MPSETMERIIKSLLILCVICALTSCYGTYYLTDSEYTDAREENASVTYYQGNVYWGWNNGYYYYYGMPHYYPWNYYYNSCPPSHHNPSTHIIIYTHVDRPTHRPNRPNINRPRGNDNTRIYVKPNKNHNTTPTRNTTKVKTNRSITKVNTNRSNTKVKTNRSTKINRGSSRNKPK